MAKIDRYEVVGQLGEGGMGVVFRAYDPPPRDRYVAVKTLPRGADPRALSQFYKECAALMSLSHPNIVEIFDMGDFDDGGVRRPFFVMPLLAGHTLQELIAKADEPLAVDRVVEIFVQVSRGLQAAHEKQLIHRDLKPSNIFVLAGDAVKVIDFGVARVASLETRTTIGGGTLPYMAPEVLQHKPVSELSDIYSLGVTLYEALTRRQPFVGATEESTVQAVLHHVPVMASEVNPEVSHLISRVAHKAMAKQPKSRFATAQEFSDALRRAAKNEPIPGIDPARTRLRIQNATRALDGDDHRLASEIVAELEAEGEIDPDVSSLRRRIDQLSRKSQIEDLLKSARACHQGKEDRLALEKLDQVLEIDPGNAAALEMHHVVDRRISDALLKPWIDTAQRHRQSRSWGPAREALQHALTLRPNDRRVATHLAEIDAEEKRYLQAMQEKAEAYRAAKTAWTAGNLEPALGLMRKVLELERVAPCATRDEANAQREFFETLRTRYEAATNDDRPTEPIPVLRQRRPGWKAGVLAMAALITIALLVRAFPFGGTSPPARPPDVPPPPVATSVLAIRQFPPGVEVSLNGTRIGVIGDDGTFSYAGIQAGNHNLQFSGRTIEPTLVSRRFAAGETMTLTPGEVTLPPVLTTVRLSADADAQVALVRDGTVLETFSGPKTVRMAEGNYVVTVRGPAGVVTSRPLKVSARVPQTVDANAMLVRGLERFDQASWMVSDSWVTRKGGGLVLYGQTTTTGAFRFTVRLDGSGNPFSSGDRLTWFVGYVNDRNHVRFEIDRRTLYRSDRVNGRERTVEINHGISPALPYVHLSVDLSGARLVHRFSTDGSTWQVMDAWTRATTPGQPDAGRRTPLDGKFGFYVPGKDEIFLSNFVYDPRSR